MIPFVSKKMQMWNTVLVNTHLPKAESVERGMKSSIRKRTKEPMKGWQLRPWRKWETKTHYCRVDTKWLDTVARCNRSSGGDWKRWLLLVQVSREYSSPADWLVLKWKAMDLAQSVRSWQESFGRLDSKVSTRRGSDRWWLAETERSFPRQFCSLLQGRTEQWWVPPVLQRPFSVSHEPFAAVKRGPLCPTVTGCSETTFLLAKYLVG